MRHAGVGFFPVKLVVGRYEATKRLDRFQKFTKCQFPRDIQHATRSQAKSDCTTLAHSELTNQGTGQPGVDLTYVKLAAEAVGDAGDQYTGLDRFGRVVSQRWIKTSTSTNVDRYGYTYDRDSNRTAKTNGTNAAFNETYGYDNLNQLTSFAKTGTTKSWDYDAVGNWDGVTTNAVTESRTQNKQNEILTATGQTAPTYDPNGNETKDFGGKTFVYDAWNRLIQVNPSGGGAALKTYELDAAGRRIETAGWQLAEERVGGVAKDQYVWSPVYVDALILRDRDANGSTGDGLEERLWAMQDANYNTTGLLNSAGTVQERYAYDPYGTAAIYDAAWITRASSSFAWNYLHQGLRYDSTTAKYYVRNREYDPQQGRWLQMDPMGFGAGDWNLYGYEGEGPADGGDATGLEDCVAGCHGQRKSISNPSAF